MNLAINVKDLSFAYREIKIFDNVSFSIEEGSFTGIIGPNGGGKTTLLKLLIGLYKPDSGLIQLLGKPAKMLIGDIGYVPQVNFYDPLFPITVQELVMLGCISEYKIKKGYTNKSKESAMNAIELLGLTPYLNTSYGKLSGGMAQRTLIARSLASNPKLLFLDEPTANVDVETKKVIYNLLNILKSRKTILMVTHDLNTVIEYVDSVILVEKKVTKYLPEKICEHFGMGLYHTPLIKKDHHDNS